MYKARQYFMEGRMVIVYKKGFLQFFKHSYKNIGYERKLIFVIYNSKRYSCVLSSK